MNSVLRILHLEDDPDYSQLVQDLLKRAGLQADIVWAKNQAEFEAAVAQGGFDVVLADYLLPYYTGMRALTFVRQKTPETPFLIVSGTIGEQAAIESLRAGATDYVLKQWPERLVPAVQRAIQLSRERYRRWDAETELARQEKYHRALTENSLDVLTVLNPAGVFIYNSPSLKRLTGYDPAEVAGQSAFTFIHPEDLPSVLAAFQRALNNPDAPATVQFRFRCRDGSWIEKEAVAQSRIADPQLAGVIVNSRDITDRKRAERALDRSEALFRSVWDHSADGLILRDENGVITNVNEAFCRLTGMARTSLEGKPFTVIYADADDAKAVLEKYRVQFGRRAVEQRLGWNFKLANGNHVIWEDTHSFVEVAGQPPLLLSALRDVTSQKRMEEQLRQSQKMEAIGQLAGGVAHDLNNILTVVQGHASLMLASDALPPSATKSTRHIAQAATRAADLTRQLLTFSRRQVMEPRHLDMNEVVGALAKTIGAVLGLQITLQLKSWPQPMMLEADASMVEQALLNLALNARDAMPQGGQFDMNISPEVFDAAKTARHPESREGNFVRVTVADNGCGIAPENLGRIFDPFFTTKETGKGTGLGLATVYGILKQHQGWIEVRSQPGGGTVFDLYFPAQVEAAKPAGTQTTESAARGGSETILVVEDEALVRELVCETLRDAGYNILEAESGVRAVDVWNRHKADVDLLLTDLVMPDRINGRQLAELLRKERPDLKIIFMSGYSADVVGKEFVRQVGLNYLQKPYHPQKLLATVRECLDQKI